MRDLFGHDTLAEAKEKIQNVINSGETHTCPCCGRFVKRYSRKIASYQAFMLAVLHQFGPMDTREWKKQSEKLGVEVTGAGDHLLLRYWDLIYQHKWDDDDDQWHITERGRLFLYGRVAVPKYAYVYNNKVLSMSEEQITIKDVKKFDLHELLWVTRPMT